MGHNVALCLCGQMRTFRRCSSSINRSLIQPLEADVFIHTWSRSGQSTKSDKERIGRKITKDILSRTYENYRTAEIERFEKCYYKKLDSIEMPDIVVEKEPVHFKGTVPHFYSIKQCNKLRLKYKKEYDLIIKLRPDMHIGDILPQKVIKNPNYLWSNDHKVNSKIQVSDKFVVADDEIFNYYAGIWKKLNKYWAQMIEEKNHDSLVGERLLKYHFDHSEFTCKYFHTSDTYILRRDSTKF